MTSMATTTDHDPGRPEATDDARAPRARLPLRDLLAIAGIVAVVVVMHLVVPRVAAGPVWSDDEIGVLANARILSGTGTYTLKGESYFPGWSLVLAPIWWFTQDPATAYRAAVVLSALCGAAVVAPFALLARRLGLGPVAATAVAAVIAVAPARLLFSTYALIENFLMLVLAWTVVAALAYAARPSLGRGVLAGALFGFAFVCHGRMIAVLAAGLLWLGWEAVRRRPGGLAGLATTVVVAGGGYLVHNRLSAILYGNATGREAGTLDSLARATPAALVKELIGQTWYTAAGWAGLTFLGIAVLLPFVVRELRTRTPSVGTWALLSTLGTVAISVAFVSNSVARVSGRIDIWAYGRYIEPLLALFALAGLTVLVRRRTLRARTYLGLLVLFCAAAAVLIFRITAPLAQDGWWGPINQAGLTGIHALTRDNMPWHQASLVVIAVLVLGAALTRWVRARAALAVLVTAYLVTGSVVAQGSPAVVGVQGIGAKPILVDIVENLDVDGEPIAFDNQDADWVGQNLYQFWFTGRSVLVFESSSTPTPPADLVITRNEWPEGEAAGALRIATTNRDDGLWVMPGALADSLVARNVLQPKDPAAPLEDFDAEIAQVEPDAGEPVGDGDNLVLDVTNEGGSTWTALNALRVSSGTGAVRVVLHWPTSAGSTPQVVDLPHSLIPGATATLDIELETPADAVDGALAVTLVQEGVEELTEPGGGPFLVVDVDV